MTKGMEIAHGLRGYMSAERVEMVAADIDAAIQSCTEAVLKSVAEYAGTQGMVEELRREFGLEPEHGATP